MHRQRTLGAVSLALLSGGCSLPDIDDLRGRPPNDSFVVAAPVECLYTAGVERVSAYIGMTEPKFVWHMDAVGTAAWFRQPLTIIDLRAASATTTEVRRHQRASAAALGQGDDLLSFLRSNPCAKRS